MKKRFIYNALIFLILNLLVASISATTLNECIQLREFVTQDHRAVLTTIAMYEARVAKNPHDTYGYLALGLLNSVLAASLENPVKERSIAVARAAEIFLAKYPNSPEGLICKAVGHSLLAKYSNNPIEQVSQGFTAFDAADKAVQLSRGTDFEVYARLMRGNIYASCPAIANKWDMALADFRLVEERYRNGMPLDIDMIMVEYFRGEILAARNDINGARVHWNASVSLSKKLGKTIPESRMAGKHLAMAE